MKILATTRQKFYLNTGDMFHLKYTGPDGVEQTVLSQPITEAMEVDVAHVIQFEDGDLGLECGIGGVFGKEKK